MQIFSSSVPAPTIELGDSVDDYLRRIEAYEQQVVEEARSLDPHPLAGEIVRTPYADGHASYVVAKVNGRVGLIHLESGDAWRSGVFEVTASVAGLRRLVEANKAWEARMAGAGQASR